MAPIQRRAVLGALAAGALGVTEACTPKARPKLGGAPAFRRAHELIPTELDFVLRADLNRLGRAGLQVKNSRSKDPISGWLQQGAETVFWGTRRLPWVSREDWILLAEGHFQDLATIERRLAAAGFRPKAGPVGVETLVRRPRGKRSEPSRVMAFAREVAVVATPGLEPALEASWREPQNAALRPASDAPLACAFRTRAWAEDLNRTRRHLAPLLSAVEHGEMRAEPEAGGWHMQGHLRFRSEEMAQRAFALVGRLQREGSQPKELSWLWLLQARTRLRPEGRTGFGWVTKIDARHAHALMLRLLPGPSPKPHP